MLSTPCRDSSLPRFERELSSSPFIPQPGPGFASFIEDTVLHDLCKYILDLPATRFVSIETSCCCFAEECLKMLRKDIKRTLALKDVSRMT